MRRWEKKIRRVAAKWLDLPQDIVMEMPRITITGPYEIHIQNHGGILRGTEDTIVLAVPHGRLQITGEKLIIHTILPEEMKVEGKLHSIEFT